MDTTPAEPFARIIELALSIFAEVTYTFDTTPARSILRLQAKYGHYQVVVTELLGESVRKYRYYLLHGNWVEAGFDNSPDPRAIRLKYGRIGPEQIGEQIPHLHRADKTQLFLTEEFTFASFVNWVNKNINIDAGS